MIYLRHEFIPKENNFLMEMASELFEEASEASTYHIRDLIYPRVEKVLATPLGTRRFNDAVGKFVSKNTSKLFTPGPQYMIPFGDTDKAEFYKVLELSDKEVRPVVNDLLKKINDKASFLYLKNNPILWVLWCCIRYFSMHNDKKSLNSALSIYALAVYPSIFSKYFKFVNEGIMQYTIDSLTNKYLIKQKGHIFGALSTSIMNSFTFLKAGIHDGSDLEAIRFIQRIHNDQNSMIKKIRDQYEQNYQKGLSVNLTQDSYDSTAQVVDDTTNDTSIVEMVSRKVSLPIIIDGIDLKRATNAARMAQISISDCRFYLSKIISSKNEDEIEQFIEAILFCYLYDEKKSRSDINSKDFLIWSNKLFRRTNNNNENIQRIKNTLDKWGEESGVHAKFTREASRINYKRAIYLYFIFSIQHYNS